jgi:glycosyltransferase involved in cell wall biosynthesis
LLVSIAINNYNYGRYLRSAIDSALGQTYPNTEIVVVDDGSTDDSWDVIASYGNRIIPVLKENGGQASAFSAGFDRSSGEVILFLDADDMLVPDAVAQAADELEDGVAVKAHWPLWEVNGEGKRTGRVLPEYDLLEGDILQEIISYGVPRGWKHGLGHAYRRHFLEQVMPVQECGDGHGADSYLCALAPVFGPIRRVSEPLGCYRSHGENFARGRQVRYRLERDARRYAFLFKWISHFLKQQGHEVDIKPWFAEGTAYDWTRGALALLDEISAFVEPGTPFILVDDGLLGTDFIPCARPMMDQDGHYAGPPESSDAAIAEIKRQIGADANYIVFTPGTFWWLEQYRAFDAYLRGQFACVADTRQLIAFDLTKPAGSSPA